MEIKFNSSINIPLFDNVIKFKNNINIDLFNNTIMFKSNTIIKKEIYIKFKSSVTIEKEKIKHFNGNINIPIENNISIFKSNIIIRKNGYLDYNGEVYIPKFKDNAKYLSILNIQKIESENKYTGAIIVRKENIVKYGGTITIPPENRLFGTIDVLGMGIFNYKGNMVVRKDGGNKYKGLHAIPIFNNINKFSGLITLRGDGYKEYKGVVKTPLLTEIPLFKSNIIIKKDAYREYRGVVSLPPENRIFSKLTVIESPRHKFYGILKKDAHVIKNTPSSNFGSDRQLYFSNGSIVYLQWTFNTNDDNMYNSENETQSFLRLYLKKALPSNSKIVVYSTDTSWNEYMINYNNRPNIEPLAEFNIPPNRIGQFDIPIGPLLNNINKLSKSFNVSLAVVIETDSSTISNSKETSIDIPALYYEYYIVPPTMRQKLFNAKVNIVPSREKKYNGFVNIIRSSDYETKNKYYKATVDIIVQINKNNIYNGNIGIPVFSTENNDIPRPNYQGSVTVAAMRNLKFGSTINTALYNKQSDYNGSITIRLDKEKIFKSIVNTARYNKEIKYNAIINTRIDDSSKFKSTVNVPKYDGNNNYKGSLIVKLERLNTFKSIVNTPKWDKDIRYISTTTVRIDRLKTFNSLINTPKYNKDIKYNVSLIVPERDYRVFKSTIKLKLFQETNKYKSSVRILKEGNTKFKCVIKIPSERRKVRVFIM